MKIIPILCFSFCCLFLCFGHASPATIRVLLDTHAQPLLLEAKGSFRVYNPQTRALITFSTTAKRDTLFCDAEGMEWGEKYPGISSIRIVPADAQSSVLVDGIEYRGCVEVYGTAEGMQIINEIDVERYLKSSMASRFPEELSSEVLEALAIALRTHTHFLIAQDTNAFWHVDAKEVGYQGYGLAFQNVPMEQAITLTRNMILTYNGAAFPAAWTKDSAGRTADFATVFRKDIATPHGVATPIAAKERPQHGWLLEISKRQLARIARLQKVTDVEAYQDKESQKTYALRVKNGKELCDVDFFTLQQALGASTLKSNDFTIEVKPETVQFKGYGEGHGVGLCLLSASYLASKGEKAQQILATFFPGTQLEHVGQDVN